MPNDDVQVEEIEQALFDKWKDEQYTFYEGYDEWFYRMGEERMMEDD